MDNSVAQHTFVAVFRFCRPLTFGHGADDLDNGENMQSTDRELVRSTCLL